MGGLMMMMMMMMMRYFNSFSLSLSLFCFRGCHCGLTSELQDFTMDMMLNTLNIDLKLIGFDKSNQKWIKD